MKRIVIDPITRLEGHGRIDVFLDDAGQVQNAYLAIPELRGFEKFCEGRAVEEMPRITAKICGVCPEAHHMAATLALDSLFHVDPPAAAHKLRELFYCAHILHSHLAHFYALAAPDFLLPENTPPSERNILGVVAKVGAEFGRAMIQHRAMAQDIQKVIGGRATYPVCGLPGGVSRAITEAERVEIEIKAKSCVRFACASVDLFHNAVISDPATLDTLLSKDRYYTETYDMGSVDADNRVAFYHGHVRVTKPDGSEFVRFAPEDYLEHIAEHVEPWTYMKFAYLKKIGWHGLQEGVGSGLARVGPLARINVANGFSTPLANEEYERMVARFGGKPIHHTMAFHWARLIEMLNVSERMVELCADPEITCPDVRTLPTATPDEGVGIVEAPRGTLIHHYRTDPQGMVRGVNLVVATGLNYGSICLSVTKAAKDLIRGGEVTESMLNSVEMAFRAYDPCMSCATHALPGRMPLMFRFRDAAGQTVREVLREG